MPNQKALDGLFKDGLVMDGLDTAMRWSRRLTPARPALGGDGGMDVLATLWIG